MARVQKCVEEARAEIFNNNKTLTSATARPAPLSCRHVRRRRQELQGENPHPGSLMSAL
jgi:hypothetical protein